MYNGGYSDTLYSFKNNLVTPLFNIYIPTKNGQVKDDSNVKSQTSYDLSIPYSGSSFFLISCIETLLDITPKNFSISINPRGLFYISTDKKRIAKVEKFIFDPLFIIDFPLRESNEDITPQSFFIEDVSVYNGPYFFGAYLDAYKLINYLELSQSNYNLNSDIIQKVNLLLSQINDDSNIVVIYGTKK